MLGAIIRISTKLQQPLPFTVLKPECCVHFPDFSPVATALIVYGIETLLVSKLLNTKYLVATALTVYGIETLFNLCSHLKPTAQLQQPLPFTVLKPYDIVVEEFYTDCVATALTVYGIETEK